MNNFLFHFEKDTIATLVLNLHDIREEDFHGESSTEVTLNVNEGTKCR